MFNPSLSMNPKAKLKPLDFSNLLVKNVSPKAVTATSPSTQDSQPKLPITKTSVNSPQSSHHKYSLFERNESVNVSPPLPQKSISFIPSIQNLKEMEITFKNERKEEILSSLTVVNKDGPFYVPSSSGRITKPKSDEFVEASGPMSTHRLNVTKERKQRLGFNSNSQQFILMNSEKPLITLQPDSPVSQSRLLSQTKEARNEKGSKASLKGFSSIKLESVMFDNKQDLESPTAGKSSKASVKSPKNAKISRTARLNLVSQVLKTNPDEEEHQKGNGETVSRTRRKIVLSPLASTSEYTLLDRERIRKQNLSNKKNLKVMLDFQAVKCFAEVKTSVAGSLSFRPQVQLFPIHTNDRKFPQSVREDINGLKDLCKLILPSKLLS